MDALGALGAFDEIQAQLKAYAGQFLIGESQLQSLVNNPSLDISTKAQQLLAEHKSLESSVMGSQSKITAFQNGSWTMSDVIEMSSLAFNLQRHISATNALVAQAKGVSVINAPFDDTVMQYIPMIGLGILGVIGVVMLKRK